MGISSSAVRPDRAAQVLRLAMVAMACHGPAADARGPHEAPLGIGRAPTPAELASWDIDVDAAGNGLPPGEGSVTDGRRLFATLCAGCHGVGGEGNPLAAQLVQQAPPAPARRNIATHWPYAPPLFDYIRRAMPPDATTPLGADTVYAIVAWLLQANRIQVPGDRVSHATLPRVAMPSRDRFVPDDRVGGREVK
jgi:cytochrome c5